MLLCNAPIFEKNWKVVRKNNNVDNLAEVTLEDDFFKFSNFPVFPLSKEFLMIDFCLGINPLLVFFNVNFKSLVLSQCQEWGSQSGAKIVSLHDKLENTPLTLLRIVHNHNLYIRIHILRPDLENQFSENNRMFVIL